MPVVTMIAGPNGSGKSTLTLHLVELGLELGDYLNADDIAATLSGPPEEVSKQAQQMVRDARTKALADGLSHCFETVLSHPSHLDHLTAAKEAGFEVRVYFVATNDPLINLGRVKNRVELGGHNVPSDRIVARYHRSLANLRPALAIADYALVFDNSRSGLPIRPLAEFEMGKHRLLMHDNLPEWWAQIVKAMELK